MAGSKRRAIGAQVGAVGGPMSMDSEQVSRSCT